MPVAIQFWTCLGVQVEHLFGSFAKKLGHGHMEFRRQPLDLAVKRIWQFYFGSFHSITLTGLQGYRQGRVSDRNRSLSSFCRSPYSRSFEFIRG